ncbi:MAG: beta-ketoacyl-[acyl-carrier-protein] synthase family protein [Phycisphaerae bacterium]|nr:beta-ketoacyl-[acyl-carrier-protein] synthase family protein [Phycisphaerae bacterium]
MTARRVVVTGLGPVSPIGIGKEAFLESLRSGKIGIDRITVFAPDSFRSQIAGAIPEFRCADYVPKSYRKSIKVMARDIELSVAGADQAVRDAGLVTKGINPESPQVDSTRLGVNIGAGLICSDLNELVYALSMAEDADHKFSLAKWGESGMNHLTPLWLLKYLPNMLACHVTIIHDAQAPSNTITCAEASSPLAIGEAYRTIVRNCADVCLCGGFESKVNPMGLIRQDLLNRLTRAHNDCPACAVRPFDVKRSGTAVAEGGSVLTLESLESAQRRNAKIYGELVGVGASFGTVDFVRPEEDGHAMAVAIERALADAKIDAGSVDLVVGFGCGTREHDQAEAKAIHQALGDVRVVSIKGQTGMMGAGTGALDATVALLAISENFIPGTVNCDEVDPACPIQVVRKTTDEKVNTVVTLSYSLNGGQIGALVFKRYEGEGS